MRLNVRELDRVGIQNFIRDNDKHDPPVFVGRENVLADITYTSNRAWENREIGYPGETRVVQGAPGAGKTAILAKLEKDLNNKKPQACAPRVLRLNSDDLDASGLVLEKLAKMVNKKEAARVLAESNNVRGFGTSVSGFGFGFDVQKESSHSDAAPPPVMFAFDRWLETLPKKAGMRGPIIVAVDEIQNVRGLSSPAAKLLRGLHDSKRGRPITLVMAGLSDSEQVAHRLGMTRGIHVHRIGCFNGDESMNLMTGFCEFFGIEIGNCPNRLEELAEPTDGWPRHLHWALVALCKAVLVAEVDGKLDRIENWEKVKSDSIEARKRYYMSQQSNEMEGSAYLLSAVMKQLQESDKLVDVKQSIEANIGATIPWSLPDGMNVHEFYDHLVHRGAIEKRDNGTIHCPIPSFRSFLISNGEQKTNIELQSVN